jgi:ATP-dependent DNA helicase RecG
MCTIYVSDGRDQLSLIYFNSASSFLKRLYPIGQKRLISGKVDTFKGQRQMIHPDFVGVFRDKDNWVGPFPVYSKVTAIGQARYRQLITKILEECPEIPEWIPEDFLKKMGWSSFKESLKQCHSPNCFDDLMQTHPARQRLAFDELLNYQRELSYYLQNIKIEEGINNISSGAFEKKVRENLPFTLIQSQEKVLKSIQERMAASKQMRGLLMGDVGSGKTIVSFMAALGALESGYQVAFLAPTALLAQQHYCSLKNLCALLEIKCGLLLGSLKSQEKKHIKERVECGEINFLIGTHALLEENVKFKNLSFIIVDEQHRFGVEQRKKLVDSGLNPDILYLSATPIPRTLAMALYGNLDVFTLKEKPAIRQPVDTLIIPEKKLKDIYSWLSTVIEKDEKVFWVCPLIEESDVLELTSATERFDKLRALFPGKVSLIHGHMKQEEKDLVMTDFRDTCAGKILVATTVIEVGIDVPDATIMIIENAERFGLSQLHQLRGRIGRGGRKGFCVLLYVPPLNSIAQERLRILKRYNDGFFIAEEDLKLRGSGNLLGTEQSGLPKFVCAEIQTHYPLIAFAKEILPSLSEEKIGVLSHLFSQKQVGGI